MINDQASFINTDGNHPYSMNTSVKSFRLIIINDSQEEAQRLSSMFHNAGKPCRAKFVDSEEAFDIIIKEQAWDLVIIDSNCQNLTPATTIRSIKRNGTDLPLVMLTDDETDRSVVDGMKLGAQDVVQLDDDQHLLLVVSRELANREHRKKTRITERKLKEIERYNVQLLDSSKDGIAFIQDGLFVFANDSFAELLGYEGKDEIEFLPLMDMIASADHDHVKQTLKNFPLAHEQQKNHFLSFHTVDKAGQSKKVDTELKLETFEEEPCIQFLVQANNIDNEALEAELEAVKYTDAITGLRNRPFMLKQLQQSIDKVTNTESTQSFILIDIDNYEHDVEDSVGIQGGDIVLKTVANFLTERSNDEDILAKIGSNSFAIITEEHDIGKLMNMAEGFTKFIDEHLFEVKEKTLHLTASAGIALINETTIDAGSVIKNALQAIKNLRKNNKEKAGVGNGISLYQPDEGNNTVLFTALQKALSNNQFSLLFQPIISLRGSSTERYEVQIQMLDENQDAVSADVIIEAANAMKITGKIDRWVVLESLKYLSTNNKSGHNAQLLINVSHYTLCDEGFIPWLKVALKASKIKPSTLVLQTNEKDVINYLTTTKKFVEDTQAIGIECSISHFGCAIDYMKIVEHIPVKQIQIDGSFTMEIQENPDDTEAITTLLKSLHDLDKVTTVPLVENATILSKLFQMGAHYIQGHYLQPPSLEMDYEFSAES